jgi:pyrroline-5-carboxylate reductase
MMGEALGRGLIGSGWAPGDLVFADVDPTRLEVVGRTLGVATASDAVEACEDSAGVLLAVKPGDAPQALSMIAGVVGPDGLVSIVAGLKTASVEGFLGSQASVVRAMPNTPARVGVGVTALSSGRYTTEGTRKLADSIFESVGPVVWLDEEKLDAVTAVSGSGPAYVFLVAEALVEAGVALGLPRDVASTLAFATIEGSGKMLRQTGEDPPALKAQVTSPGGTTAAALSVLEAMAVRAAFNEAVRAAWRRSKELGS